MTAKINDDNLQRIRELCGTCLPSIPKPLVKHLLAEVDSLRRELEAARERERWIPVGERMPVITDGSSDWVLVDWHKTDEDENSSSYGAEWVEVEKAFLTSEGMWISWDGYEKRTDDPDAPTHWRPLPEPPKGEDGCQQNRSSV